MNELKRLFGKAIDSIEKASITHGYLGRFLLDGSEQVEVPGQPDIVWVRVGAAETDISVTRAKNVGVPLIFGLPVRMKLIDGQYRIIDIDHDRLDVGVEPPTGAINSVWGLVDTPYDPEDNQGKILVVLGTDLVFDHASNHPHALSELDDVSLGGSIVDGQALIWNDSTSLWVRGIPIHDIDDHSNVNIISPMDGQILRYDAAENEWVNDDEAAGGGVTDHTLLSNIGTNTHDQIDTHIADSTLHFTEGSITHNNLSSLTSGDPHTQYPLLVGRSGGQTLIGDTASDGRLILHSTTHATKGPIELNPSSGNVLIGGTSETGSGKLQVTGTGYFSVRLGVGAPVPSELLHLASAAPGFRFQNTATGGGDWLFYASQDGDAAGGGLFTIRRQGDTTAQSTLILDQNKNLGLGVISPQGRIHGHDGTGGFLHVTKTNVGGTAQTIIPDGTGDVVRGLRYTAVIRLSSGLVTHGIGFLANGDDGDIYNNGTNTEVLKLRVNANGSVDVRRSAGSATYTVTLWLLWL